jgi:hypothetical protein
MKTFASRAVAKALFAAFNITLPAAAWLAVPTLAQAQGVEQVHIRGSIVSAGDKTVRIKTREGKTLDVALAGDARIAGVARAAIADIKPGDFVGIASLPRADGGDGALEVVIFPPAMKGAGEGSYGWDLKPNSSMTNATVANAVKGVDGHTVTVTYHGKEKKITIPEGTPVVTLAPATIRNLVPGAVVFMPASKDAKGGLTSHQVVVGANGVVPPM